MDVCIVLLPRLVRVKPCFCVGTGHPAALCRAVWEPLSLKRGILWGLQAEATNGAENQIVRACCSPSVWSLQRPARRGAAVPGTAAGLRLFPGVAGTGRQLPGRGESPASPPADMEPTSVAVGDPARERRGRKDGQSCGRKSARWLPLNLSFLFLGSSIVSCPCSVVRGHFSPPCPFSWHLVAPLCYPAFNELSVPSLLFLSHL